jgi:hypothetical protein
VVWSGDAARGGAQDQPVHRQGRRERAHRLAGLRLLAWFERNPNSGCHLRQLPISGMDTKWLDGKRRGVLVDLLQAIRADFSEHDLYRLCGLRRSPHRVRMRVLCPELRTAVKGLIDVEAPLEQLAALRLRPACCGWSKSAAVGRSLSSACAVHVPCELARRPGHARS